MVDNITLNSGSGGATLATDDDGTAHHQYVKIEFGADNTQTKVSSSNPLPVDASGTTVTVSGTITADAGTGTFTIDGAHIATEGSALGSGVLLQGDDGTDRKNVAVDATSGNVQVDVGSALPAGDNNIGNVDLASALPAGTNAIGKLAANSGVDIGDVDVTSIVPGTGASNLGKAEDAAHTTGDVGVMALSVRNDTLAALAGLDGDYAPLQVNASGALYIQEGTALDVSAATVTVSGTVTADAGTGTFTVTDDGSFTLAANSGTDIGDVDVTSVTPGTGASSLGKAEDAAHTTGDVGVMSLAVRNDTLAALAGTDGDYAPFQVNASGALFVQEGAAMDVSAATVTVTDDGSFTLAANDGVDIGDVDVATQPARVATTDTVGAKLATDAIMDDTTALTPKFAAINVASSGNNTLVAAVAGKKIRVLAYTIVAGGDVLARFEDGAGGGALTGQMDLTTNSGISCAFCPVGHFETTANTLLNLELDGAVSVDGHLTYVEV